jgi:hypothetical protein
MYPGWILTRNSSKRAAADPRLRPSRHWHPHLPYNWQRISADLTAYLRQVEKSRVIFGEGGIFQAEIASYKS